MRKMGLSLISVLAVLMFLVSAGASAQAADQVYNARCYDSDGELGRICVGVYFDNTNCPALSTSGCDGLNGAQIESIYISTTENTDLYPIVGVAVDVYGDGTSDYLATHYHVTPVYTSGNVYKITWPSSYRADINRVCVNVSSIVIGDGFYSIGGMNPYGLSQAGACGF